MKYFPQLLLTLFSVVLWVGCADEPESIPDPVVFDDTPYNLEYGQLPIPDLPEDNPLTIEGVKLGRMLFYDPVLSEGNVQACADCHRLPDGLSDTARFSVGVRGETGERQAMAIFNLGWHSNGFFWDGRAAQLRDQALLPIQDPLEMDESLEDVVAKLGEQSTYQDQFVRAFEDGEINPENISLALEQFMLSVVSYNSKYDRFLRGEVSLTESEERGRVLFETEFNPGFPELSGADCQHCHGGINFENDQYMNNGLDIEADFDDIGFEKVTKSPTDRAKFKVPSLRNIAVTPPYMHDGRFQTLEEVVDHYNTGIQESSTVDPAILMTKPSGLQLTEQDRTDLVNFLKTLTDPVFLENTAYSSPF